MSSPNTPVEIAPVSVPPEAADPSLDRLMRAAASNPARDSEAELDRMVEEAMAGVSGADLTASVPKDGGKDIGEGLHRGTISRVTAEEVFIDLGGKTEGILPKNEFDDPAEIVIGREILVSVERFDTQMGAPVLSKRTADRESLWENLKVGDELEGKTVGMNKGGLELKMTGGFRAFMPASQVDVRRTPDISVFLNQSMRCQVTRIDRGAKELVVSRRAIVEREQKDGRARMLTELAEGQIRSGTVRSVTDFGAFVDLGGVDGLLHVSDMSWARVRTPADLVKPGDTLDVVILKIDREKEKISLGLKQKKTDPWVGIEERYPAGSKFKGRVVRVAPFGAFVELEEGVDGLVHISEMSWIKRLNHPSELVKEGNIVEAVILKIDNEKREVRLGMKQVEANPWDAVPAKYPIGAIVKGKVARLSDFGAFVELEPGIEGLVHISEMSDTRVRRVSDVAEPGKEVTVKVLGVDTGSRRIGLSIKQAVAAPPPPVAAAPAPAPAAAAEPAAPPPEPKKRKTPLRGGLGGFGKIGG